MRLANEEKVHKKNDTLDDVRIVIDLKELLCYLYEESSSDLCVETLLTKIIID